MKSLKYIFIGFVFGMLFFPLHGFSQNMWLYYFPESVKFNLKVPSPGKFFGRKSGQGHTRYDQVVQYFQELERVSDKVKLDTIGYTWEKRPLIVLKVSAKRNLNNLEQIRSNHLKVKSEAKTGNLKASNSDPALVFLGFSVHGNETSAADASLLTAYYLAAAENPEVSKYLENAIFFIDPVRNPDGYDRYVNWVNSNTTFPPVNDPLDREHNETWPGGRTNHYWFDLNRDWINQVHPESKARVSYFQKWLPHFQGDFHEMFASSTFFFEPTKPDAQESPLVPKSTYALNNLFAGYYAKALDTIGALYYTKEQFDNINPTYGSTYPDHAGSLGILFEQASPRGLVQKTASGDLTYGFAIRNHLRIALATIEAAVEHKSKLQENQIQFFKSAYDLAAKDPVKAYIINEEYARNSTKHFKELLLRHQIDFYENTENRKVEGRLFKKNSSFIIPAAQANYRLVKVIFDNVKQYVDSVFYDGSGNSLAHLYGFQYAAIQQPVALQNKIDQITPLSQSDLIQSNYAYIVDWRQDGAAWLLSQLLQNNVKVKTATSPFSLIVKGKEISFDYGSLLIPVGIQSISKDSLHHVLKDLTKKGEVEVTPAQTGYSVAGIDLGSNNFKVLQNQNAVVLTGSGVNAYEAGEIWYAFERKLGQSIVRINLEQFNRASLDDYQVLILPGGDYSDLTKPQIEKIQNWVKNGGSLIALSRAGEWLATQGIASFKFLKERGVQKDETKREETKKERFTYASSNGREGAKRIGGAYFNTEIDVTHPIGFGYTQQNKAVYRNHNIFVELGVQPYNNVAVYTKNPLLNGYTSTENQKKLEGTSSIVVENTGNGRIIYFVEDPLYRGISFANERAFFNAVLFGQILQTSNRR